MTSQEREQAVPADVLLGELRRRGCGVRDADATASLFPGFLLYG